MVHKGFHLNDIFSAEPGRPARFFFLALGGILTGITLIFPKAGIIEWLSLVPASLVLLGLMRSRRTKLRHIYGYGFFFFMSFYLVIYHWFFYLYPLEFTGMSRGAAVVVVLAGWIGLSLLQALGGGFVFLAAALLGRTELVKKHTLIQPFVAAALWTVFEWSQTLFWFGVPWGRLAIGQSEMPLMIRSASLFGTYLITFLIVAVNSCIAYALLAGKSIRLPAFCAVGLLLLNLTLGGVASLIYNNDKSNNSVNAAVIQGNIASSVKWELTPEDIFDIYAAYTRRAAEEGAELIVWPETALPITLDGNPNRVRRICDLAVGCGADIIVGMFTEDSEGGEYNSLVLFRRDGTISEDVYSKRHLVPFGEYMPLRDLLTVLIPPLSEIAMLDEDLSPGADSGLIVYDDMTLGSLICFDSIYEELTRQSVRDGADIIILSTNDSWFFDSAAVRMHNAQAKLRSVESGCAVLRAANTGISSVILPDGTVVDELPALVGGYIVAKVGTKSYDTLYMLIGNIFVYAAAAFILFIPVTQLIKMLIMKKTHKNQRF